MATLGEALEALDDFRAVLVDRQMNTPIASAQALAFRSSRDVASDSMLNRVHATGVGVREEVAAPGADDFVVKVYVFDRADMAAAAHPSSELKGDHHGTPVDVQYLPVQSALATAGAQKATRKTVPRAAAPAQHQRRIRPVPGGVEIGPLGGSFVGTLGCFVRRGAGDSGPLFVLSNNHVLADVNRFALGSRFTQPFSSNAADVVAALSGFEPIRFPAPGSQPRNVIDAAIAAVTNPAQCRLGTMLNIARYVPTLLAPRPGMQVIKAGRTTGVTTGVIRATRVRGVQVNYGTTQNPLIATFDNAITITGSGGVPFSKPGDSGSVILEIATGQPVALLFAGDLQTTTACDLATACARFSVRPV